MSDFEYKILGPPFTEKKLNEMGKLGWQLVSIQDKKFYFMREIPIVYITNNDSVAAKRIQARRVA